MAGFGDERLRDGAVVVQERPDQDPEQGLLGSGPDGRINGRIILQRIDRCRQGWVDFRHRIDPGQILRSVAAVSGDSGAAGNRVRTLRARPRLVSCAAGLEVDAGEGAATRFGAGRVTGLGSRLGFESHPVAAARKTRACRRIVAVVRAEMFLNKPIDLCCG